MYLAQLDLDLDVFSGPFDLLLTLILREDINLLEVELAEVILTYIDHLDQRGELDLEATTEFLVLITALLELKSRLMLPQEEVDLVADQEPLEAADELLARMLSHARYKSAGGWLRERLEGEQDYLYRVAPLPPELRRAPIDGASVIYNPALLGRSLGGLLKQPERIDTRHIRATRVSLEQRLGLLRTFLKRGKFSFDETVAGEDRVTVAVTLFALLELYKQGEATWEQEQPFSPVTVEAVKREIRVHAASPAARERYTNEAEQHDAKAELY